MTPSLEPTLYAILEIINNVGEIPGYRLTTGETLDTIILEKSSVDDGWQIALRAVPILILRVWRRLVVGDESAIIAMNIHCHGKEVDWEDICQPCIDYGVLTGGCKRMEGPCSSCVFNGRGEMCN